MGLFSRRTKDDDATIVDPDTPPDVETEDGPGLDPTGRPVAHPLGDAERARVDAALEHAAAEGVDVDDLASIGSHYDEAFRRWSQQGGAEGPDVVVETYAVAIGEHLARHSAREWAVVTDVFGTDLGLVAARADTVVVPHNLVGARWMRGETGWVPRVVSHLLRIQPRGE
jgi:hypothetical protein